jgi:ABC-type multidrug transport system fused ATPase/permease subunit
VWHSHQFTLTSIKLSKAYPQSKLFVQAKGKSFLLTYQINFVKSYFYRFVLENELHLESSQKAQFCGTAASQWLGLRLQFFGVILVGGVGALAVVQHHYGYGVNPGLVGLAITYALSTTSLLNGVINAFTETEKEMIAVERVQDYVRRIPQEPPSDAMPPLFAPWPNQGVLTFTDVHFRHRQVRTAGFIIITVSF